MRFATFKGDKSIGDLIARIFKSPPAADAAAATADALVRANPGLANLKNVAPGATIIVPDSITLPVNPAEVKSPALPVSAGRRLQITQSLTALKTALPPAATAAVAGANAALALVNTAQVQAAAAKDPALAQRLAAISAQANGTLQNIPAQQGQLLKAIDQLTATLG